MSGGHRFPFAIHQDDVYTFIEILRIVNEVGGQPVIVPHNQTIEAAGTLTEFCIGGPLSNSRTKAHLSNYLKGVIINPYDDTKNSMAILTKEDMFFYERGEKEYSVLAKFWPKTENAPIFLICGQTAVSNRAAAYFLAQNYDSYLRMKFDDKPFCLVLCVPSPMSYSYKMVEIVKDITNIAFDKFDFVTEKANQLESSQEPKIIEIENRNEE